MPKPYSFNDTFDQPDPQCPQFSPEPVDIIEPIEQDPQGLLFEQMAELLTPIFLFLSQGVGCKHGDTMGVRAWVVTHVVRPDLTRGETVLAYTRRSGVAHACVLRLIAELRALIPSANVQCRSARPASSTPTPR
jgi:hypothetical protein